MKAIILAAGEGTRLRPYTLNKPKCMVELKSKPIIDYIVETFISCGIDDIVIIGGYKNQVLINHFKDNNFKFYYNPKYNDSNMVYTLFCAKEEFNDDIIITYSDIVYDKKILEKLISEKSSISTIIDKDWKKLWELRMEDPLLDAETLKISKDDNIIELGKKPKSFRDIEGQYIGLTKIASSELNSLIEFYNGLDKKNIYDGKDFDNMYMTSFIQLIIDNYKPVKAVFIEGGWLEVDSCSDLDVYNRNFNDIMLI